MATTLLSYYTLLPALVLVIARIGGLTIASPLFTAETIPLRIKGLFVVAASLAVFPAVAPTLPAHVTVADMVVGLFGELALGALLGLAVTLVFTAAQMAGAVVGLQAGLGIGEIIDPITGSSSSEMGQFLFVLVGFLFLAIGGERETVLALLESFRIVPVLSFRPGEPALGFSVEVLRMSFVLAMALSAPALIALLLSMVVMGFLSRTMPQLHILTVGFSIKIVIALLVLSLTFPLGTGLLSGMFEDVFAALRSAIRP